MLRFTFIASLTISAIVGCASTSSTPVDGGQDEHAATIAAMKPPKRARPVIAVVGQNDGTETTDFIVPYAVLAASGVADVVAVAPEARTIRLTPALAVEPHQTLAAFDARHDEGADYVIVPRIDDAANPAVVSWIQSQAEKGAIIVGVCSGVKTVAAAGLLDGRRATGHWYDIAGLRQAHPTMEWVRDRRYVVDRGVVTTTGVSASLPVSLALVEAIGGRARAGALAAELGAESWDTRHDSSAFKLDAMTLATIARNKLLGATPDIYAIPVAAGVDDVALAFPADAWSRTLRSRAIAVGARPVTTRYGLDLVLDEQPETARILELAATAPAETLPRSLAGIAARYDAATAAFVALQLEDAWDRP